MKISYVIVNEPEQFRTTCALVYSVPNRFKLLVQCCVHAFVRRLIDAFATLKMLRRPLCIFAYSSYSFSDVLEVFSLPSLSYVIEFFSSLFVSQPHVRFSLERSDFDLIPDLIDLLTCLLLKASDLIISLRSRTCFLLLSIWVTSDT